MPGGKGGVGWRDFIASVPFFIVSVTLGLVTAWSATWYMKSQLINPAVIDIGGFASRFVLAGQNLSFYFTKCFWPLGPLPIYPQWKVDPASPFQYLPWLVLAGAAYWLWEKRESWGRHVLLGLGFFTLTLGPFLGFVPISYMSFTWVMDHFLYLPIIGIIGIVVAGIEDVDGQLAPSHHPLSSGILTILMGLLAFESHWYGAAFTNEETFWSYTLDHNPRAWMAHNNLGKILLQENEPEPAMQHFYAVIQAKPELGEPYANLANSFVQLGRIPEANEALHQALALDPHSPESNNDLGILLAQNGQTAEALSHFEEALRGRPLFAEAHNNMGETLLLAGRVPEAIGQFQAAIQSNPSYGVARDGLGLALAQAGRIPEAVAQFQEALQIDPNDAKARESLQKLQTQSKNPPPEN